jgi:photosystem II stability/assembly factor-like uncharacterized protein
MKAYFCVFFILALQTSYPQWQTFYVANQNVGFVDVCVVNDNIIWAFGVPNTTVFKTTNGGESWNSVSPNIPYSVGFTVSALDDNSAWLSTDSERRLYRTTNGGLNWTQQLYLPHQIGYTISEIHFFNQNTGVFLNNTSSSLDTTNFYITRNGGQNWYISQYPIITTGLITKCFGALDTNFMWLTDDNRVYTLYGGLDNQWQVHTIDTLNPILLVSCFINSSTGYVGEAISSLGLRIFKTTNSGLHWTVYSADTARFGTNSLLFVANTNMVFLNGQFNIRISRDYGISWQHQVKYTYNIDSISMWYMDAYDTNSVWIAVNKGRLFKYNIDYIGIEPIGTDVPISFRLFQNYPNPFNPSTKICFELPIASDFSIKVYDILGREVYAVYDSKQAGEYELKFDGAAYASGIYFYQIKASSFVDTKKMILLK